jgi:dihydroflavonol-4-reductase
MRALVTGGNGHLGYNMVATLLARGHQVRSSVRSITDADKTARLRALGPVELVEADVRNESQMKAALDGIDTLFHLAAVFSTTENDRAAEILDSAVRGTETTLRAAAAAGVKRVIMTSSVVTLPLVKAGEPSVTEKDWTTDLRIPYFRAKVESERKAWELAKQLGLELTTILPAGIIGPGFARPTPTIHLVRAALMGEFRLGAPHGNFSFVDVRDVAEAHALAFERGAQGRFIVGYDHVPTFQEIVLALRQIDPGVKPPLMVMPAFMSPTLATYDALCHLVLGTPRIATREVIESVVSGKLVSYSCERAKTVLGWTARVPLEQSLRDTIKEMGWRIREA